MMRFLFVRVIIPVLIILVVRAILRSIFSGWSRQVAPRPARPMPTTVSPGGELKKDPVCGTYVSTEVSMTKRIGGQTYYFCSAACRDKYRVAS